MQDSFGIGERLRLARTHSGLNKSKLGDKVGASGTSINNIETGVTKKPSADLLAKIASELKVDLQWLLTGEGKMETSNEPVSNAITIGGLTLTPLSEVEYIDLPFVPVPARATFVEMAAHPTSYGTMNTWRVYYPPKSIEGKKSFVIEIDGDSMEPQLKRGDKVLIVEIPKGDWVYQTGKIYAVAYGNSFVIKRITKNDLMLHNQITLTSDNPKGGEIVLSGNEIRGMWRVLRAVESDIE